MSICSSVLPTPKGGARDLPSFGVALLLCAGAGRIPVATTSLDACQKTAVQVRYLPGSANVAYRQEPNRIPTVAGLRTLSTSPGYEVKELAIGLAAAIILDATIIRALRVTALMRLLGQANWWMPKWTRAALRIPEQALGANLTTS
jgi:hypothetical protein